jgi:hypothetical protein
MGSCAVFVLIKKQPHAIKSPVLKTNFNPKKFLINVHVSASQVIASHKTKKMYHQKPYFQNKPQS